MSDNKDHKRITSKYLSKYERAKIIGERAVELDHGSEPKVEVGETQIDHLQIAEKELEEGKLDMIIRRFLPNDKFEDWKVDELVLPT